MIVMKFYVYFIDVILSNAMTTPLCVTAFF